MSPNFFCAPQLMDHKYYTRGADNDGYDVISDDFRQRKWYHPGTWFARKDPEQVCVCVFGGWGGG